MTRDEMIEVAARVCRTEYATILSGPPDDFDERVARFVGSSIIDALIAAGVIPDPETTVAEVPVPYVAIGNGEPVPPALQALYESLAMTWGKE